MENTILKLVEICRQKELLCMHDNIDDLIESALNSKLLSINLNSQRLDKKEQEFKNVVEQPTERRTRIIESLQNIRVIHKSSISLNNTSQISPVHAVAPILSNKEPEYSPSMGYEHPNTTLETASDEIIKSGVGELVPVLNENEVTSEDKRECDMPVYENSPVCDDHSEIFSDSNIDDDILSDDDDFKDIEYVEASLPDPEIVSVEEENVVYHEKEENDINVKEEEFDLEEIQDVVLQSDNSLSDNFSPKFETFCNHTEETRSGNTTTHVDDSLPEYDLFYFEIEPNQERLINVVKNDISDDSSNDPLLEEAGLFLASDNSIPPGIENFAYDSEGDIRFLEALLIDNSIPFPNNESPAFDFDNPSFPRPPPEPPDSEIDAGDEISVVMNDELECLDLRDEIDVSTNHEDDDYFPFMFVIRIFLPYLIYPEVSLLFLFAESEATIFDPELLCMHDNIDDLIESALNSKLLSINLNSQLLDKKEQEFKNVVEQPTEPSLPDPEIVSVEEENVVYHEKEDNDINVKEEEFDLEEIQDVVLREKLLSINRLITNIESLNDNPTPDRVFNSSFHFLSLKNSEIDAGDEISVVMNDELECLDLRDEIDVSTNHEDDDYFPFMFVIRIFLPYLIYPDVSLLFLSAESEATIFDPGISV
nr:hypothetical protein [Tanacetum cinerariifolium]